MDKISNPVLEGPAYSRDKVCAIFQRFRKTASELRFRALVSPAMAKKIMAANQGNRKLRETHVEALARALTQKEWMENGDSLKFAKDGRLLDGQHRLEASIVANVPFQTDVVLDLEARSQMTMDGGLRRSVSDNLGMRNEKYANNLPATMRWIYWLAEDARNYRTTTQEMIRFLDRYPGLRDSVKLAQAAKWRGSHSAIIATIHFLACTFMNQQERADAFVSVWNNGLPNYQNDPVWRLRENIRTLKLSGKQHTPQKLCDLIVHSYNLFSDKRAPARLIDPNENIKLKDLDVSRVDLNFT